MVTSEEGHESTAIRDSCLILLHVLIDMLLKVIGSLAVCGYEVRNRRAVVLSAGQSTFGVVDQPTGGDEKSSSQEAIDQSFVRVIENDAGKCWEYT